MGYAEGAPLPLVCGRLAEGETAWMDGGCQEALVRKGDDACCPVHGVMLEGALKPPPPLEGRVHLNFGGGHGTWVDVAELRRAVAGIVQDPKSTTAFVDPKAEAPPRIAGE